MGLRYDQMSETSVGLYVKNNAITDWMKVTLGVRGDLFMASVDSTTTAENSGYASGFLASPKFGAVFGPFDKTEFYLNAGFGYHSNDARGSTITVSPTDPTQPLSQVPLLVQSKGAEVGAIKGLDMSLALLVLDFNSELHPPIAQELRQRGVFGIA